LLIVCTSQIGIGDRLPGPPADHAQLDLAVAGEASFEIVLWVWHDALLPALNRLMADAHPRKFDVVAVGRLIASADRFDIWSMHWLN
jgi:hypothetical protein